MLRVLRRAGRRLRREEGGFTIVEAMVAMLVLAGGVLGTVELVSSTKKGSAVAERTSVAVVRAEQALEELRNVPYDQLALSAQPQPGTGTGAHDPRRRASAGRLEVRSGLREELVVAAGGVAPMQTQQIGGAGNPTRVTIHRFVSWRDEECPALNLASLDQLVSSLPGLINSVSGSLGVLAGPNGSLNQLVETVDDVSRIPLLGGLLRDLLRVLDPLMQPVQALSQGLTGVLNPLQAVLAPLNGLGGVVSQRLDLCDLDIGLVRELGKLKTLHSLLSALSPLLRSLEAPIGTVNDILTPLLRLNLFGLLTAVPRAIAQLPAVVGGLVQTLTQIPQALASLGTDLANLPQFVSGLAGSLVDTLEQLLLNPDHARNTKRVTVAVVVDSPGQTGPQRPIWASTVVTDPHAGIGG